MTLKQKQKELAQLDARLAEITKLERMGVPHGIESGGLRKRREQLQKQIKAESPEVSINEEAAAAKEAADQGLMPEVSINEEAAAAKEAADQGLMSDEDKAKFKGTTVDTTTGDVPGGKPLLDVTVEGMPNAAIGLQNVESKPTKTFAKKEGEGTVLRPNDGGVGSILDGAEDYVPYNRPGGKIPKAKAKAKAEAGGDGPLIINDDKGEAPEAKGVNLEETTTGGVGAGFFRSPRAVLANIAARGGKTPEMRREKELATIDSIKQINELRETDPVLAEQMQARMMNRRPGEGSGIPGAPSSPPPGMDVVKGNDGKVISTRIQIPEEYGGGAAFGGPGTSDPNGRFADLGEGKDEFGAVTRGIVEGTARGESKSIIDRDAIRGTKKLNFKDGEGEDAGSGFEGIGDLIGGPDGDLDRFQARDQVRRNAEHDRLKNSGKARDLFLKKEENKKKFKKKKKP